MYTCVVWYVYICVYVCFTHLPVYLCYYICVFVVCVCKDLYMYIQCVNMFVWCRYMWVDILGLHM